MQDFDKDISANVSRRESQSQTRRNKNVEDVKTVAKTDETYHEEDLKPVIFVAKDLYRVFYRFLQLKNTLLFL